MAKLLNNKQTFRWQPAVLELKDHIVMNRQIYNKSTLDPVPFKTLDINSYDRKHIIGKTTWTHDTDGAWENAGSSMIHGGQTGMSSFAVDSNDSSIGYVICPRDDNVSLRAHKISLETFDLLVTGATDLGASTASNGYYDYPGQAYIFYQDDDYIYYIHKHRNNRRYQSNAAYWNVGMPLIGWMSKTDMLQKGEYANAWDIDNLTYLGMKGTKVFFAVCGVYYAYSYINSRNDITIRWFDTSTKTGGSLGNWTSPGGSNSFRSFGNSSRPFDQGSDVLHSYWTSQSTSADEGYLIYKAETDMNGETATVSGCTYDFSALASGTTRGDVLVRHLTADYNHKVHTFTTDDGANKYVNFLITETPTKSAITMDAFRVHTFLIGGADNSHLTYKSTAEPGFRMRGIMPLEDDYTKFLVIGDSHSEVWTWNEGLEEYTFTSTINVTTIGAMTDQLNRLWIYDDQDNAHLISNTSPLTVTIEPEYSSYNYQGTTISSYVEVSAWDMDSNRMDADVQLILEGSTYFLDDTQSKEITTSSGSETQVDIKITGTSFTRMFGSIVV